MHVAVALPVGIEERRLVGDADVLLKGRNDGGIPGLSDAARSLLGIHATAENSISCRGRRGDLVANKERSLLFFGMWYRPVGLIHNYRKATTACWIST